MMSTDYSDKYVFEAEWYDKTACIMKKFYLYYYPSDNTVELVCIKLTQIDILIDNKECIIYICFSLI